MRIAKDDYLIGRDKKEFLCRAMEDSTGDVTVYLEDKVHIPGQRKTMTLKKADIVLNLGAVPSPGKVYGCDVTNLFRRKKEHDEFGDISFFYKPDKIVVQDLWIAFTKMAKLLKKHGLSFLTESLEWEILRFTNEKVAGMYIHSHNEKMPNRIQIRPEIMPASEYVYVLAHELGHHLHLEYLHSKKLNAHWLRIFNTSIKVETIKKEKSLKLLEMLLSQEDVPSAFKGQLDEEDALAFKWIVRTIATNNSLTIKELDTLFEAEMLDDIRELWPQRTISHKELAPVLTEYATKNYKELVAESFAFYMCGKKQPQGLVKLLEKSISYAKAQRG